MPTDRGRDISRQARRAKWTQRDPRGFQDITTYLPVPQLLNSNGAADTNRPVLPMFPSRWFDHAASQVALVSGIGISVGSQPRRLVGRPNLTSHEFRFF